MRRRRRRRRKEEEEKKAVDKEAAHAVDEEHLARYPRGGAICNRAVN
jgi:hypothetical protein